VRASHHYHHHAWELEWRSRQLCCCEQRCPHMHLICGHTQPQTVFYSTRLHTGINSTGSWETGTGGITDITGFFVFNRLGTRPGALSTSLCCWYSGCSLVLTVLPCSRSQQH
jgi:hypothetical protein